MEMAKVSYLFIYYPFYFNYLDIIEMTVIPDSKGRTDENGTLKIFFRNGSTLRIKSSSFDATLLEKTIVFLKKKSELENQFPVKNLGTVFICILILKAKIRYFLIKQNYWQKFLLQ